MNHARLVGALALLALAAVLFGALPGGQRAAGQQTSTIGLQPGWNLVSLPLVPADPAPAAVLTSIAGKFNSAWAYQTASSQAGAAAAAATWLSYDPNVPPFLNTLAAIDVSMGFWLNMKEAATLSLSGSEPASTQIAVSPGWNFIGYPAGDAKPIADVMGSLAYNSVWAYDPSSATTPWESYDPNVPPFLNTLQQFTPGRGYALNTSAAGTLTVTNGPASPTPFPVPTQVPSSFDLIAQALEAGEIDEETALAYDVFATFGDERLPQKYRAEVPEIDSDAVARLQARFDSLSTETQDMLAPFLLPPSAPGSWLELREGTAPAGLAVAEPSPPIPCPPCNNVPFKTFETDRARIWWSQLDPGGEAVAQKALAAIQTIWDAEVTLMQPPQSDDGLPNNGGDGKYDIYVLNMGVNEAGAVLGENIKYFNAQGPPCPSSPSYIMLNSLGLSQPDTHAEDTLAHEFFHAIQRGYTVAAACDARDYKWLDEATAEWAVDLVYPNSNSEHEGLGLFIDRYHQMYWDNFTPFAQSDHYDDYLFFFYLARKYGNAIIPQIYQAAAQKSPLTAVNDTIPGRFKERWKEFALYMWNVPPWDYFNQWDGIEYFALTPPPLEGEDHLDIPIEVDSKPTFEAFGGLLRALSARYYYFTAKDPSARMITVSNPYPAVDFVAVQVVFSIGGGERQLKEIAAGDQLTFCRDDPTQDVTGIVVIVSDSDWQQTVAFIQPPADPLLEARDSCGCPKSSQQTPTPAAQQAGATPVYEVVELPFRPEAINNRCDVVGRVPGGNGYMRTKDGELLDLGDVDPHDINDSGQVTGRARVAGEDQAFIWEDGNMTLLGPDTEGFGINNAGHVVGEWGYRAFLWKDGTMTDLGTLPCEQCEYHDSYAVAINDQDQVAGDAYTDSACYQGIDLVAFLWQGGAMSPLPFPSCESEAVAINNAGQVVANDFGGDAYLWDNGAVTDLGPGAAYGINNLGQVVGEFQNVGAGMWENGAMIDLDTLLPPGSGWDLTIAYDINDSGQIVGRGRNPQGQITGFLLTTCAECVAP